MKTLVFTAALVALPTSLAAPPHNGNRPSKALGLNDHARRAGLLYFGTAIDNISLNQTAYLKIAHDSHEFGQVTPSNGQKWMFTEPTRGVFNWTMGDEIIKPALKNGQLTRCHTFLWHNQLPDWLTGKNYTKTELLGILDTHIKGVARHYGDDCYAWDVANEAFEEDGTLRKTLWLDTIGPSYLEEVFKIARKYVSRDTKLYYNDYNIERVNNKSIAVRDLVKGFKRKGVPIDGVGFQGHFSTGRAPTYQNLTDSMAQFNRLGVEVAITELDVRTVLPDSPEKQAQQAVDYANAVKACKDAKDCVGVTVWDFWDPVSWVPGWFEGEGNACLYSANFTKKPAYHAIVDVLKD
jgi:endo-1,4-beta-xylanase